MKINQTTTIALLAAGALLAFQPALRAEDKATNAPPKTDAAPPGGGGQNYSPEQRFIRLNEVLSLTDEQKPKVKAIIDEQAKEMAASRDLPQEERRAKRRAMREEMGKKLKPILTDEQFKKWEAWRPGGGPPGGGTPAPSAPKPDAPKS